MRPLRPGGAAVTEVTITLSDDAMEALARRAAQLVADRQSTDGDGWLRGADKIAAHIDSPESRVYALNSAGRIPVYKDGSALVAMKSELNAWMRNGGGKRP